MNLKKWKTHPIFTGTVILTATGLASRIIGFLYRIFLSHTIGATGLGIYQLVFPILTLCLALCTGGIQTAISKYTAESEEHAPLYCGICVCMALSACCTFVLYRYAPWLATHVVCESACAPLLRIISFLPFIIGLSNIFGIQTMVAFGMQRLFSRILMASAAVNFLLVFPLVWAWQEIGMAITVVCVETFVTVTMYIALRRHGLRLV